MKTKTPETIDEYIQGFPKPTQAILKKIRLTIRKAAPDATETISYQIPAFRQGSVLVYFAGFSDHISFFPTSSGVANFRKELEPYKTSKGTVQFPMGRPIPYGLIAKITKFRAKEVLLKTKRKQAA